MYTSKHFFKNYTEIAFRRKKNTWKQNIFPYIMMEAKLKYTQNKYIYNTN